MDRKRNRHAKHAFPSGAEPKNISVIAASQGLADKYPLKNESFIKLGKSRMRQAQDHRVRMRKHAGKVLEEVGYHISFQLQKYDTMAAMILFSA